MVTIYIEEPGTFVFYKDRCWPFYLCSDAIIFDIGIWDMYLYIVNI